MRELLTSKKALVLLVGLVAIHLKWIIEKGPYPQAEVAAMVSAYLVGQGIADAGKEKILAMNAAAKPAKPEPPKAE